MSPQQSCLTRFIVTRQNSRIGSLVVLLGVLGVLVFVVQWEDVLPRSTTRNGSIHTSSFIDCSNTTLSEGVRTRDNNWGAFDPVITSTHCTTVLASALSPDPMDWLEMCRENHDIYQRYMESKPKNYLKQIIPRTHGNQTSGDRIPLLIIGDSLDNYMARHICRITGAVTNKVDPPAFSRRRAFVCSSPQLEIGYLNIFGMYRTCDNDGVAYGQDPRVFNTTVDRVATILPEVLARLENPPQYVLISSALWDLSNGCVGRSWVPQSYRDEYSLGMRRMYDYLTSEQGGLDTNASIYWRTTPPVRKRYSSKWTGVSLIPFNVGGHGRTRGNQKVLNRIMHETFREYQLGSGIVDWWQIVQGTSERFLNEELRDGRHYSFCSSLAFFNEWLDQIHHPQQ